MRDGKGVIKTIIVGFLILMAFLFALSISGSSYDVVLFWKALGAQILMLGISFLIYFVPDYHPYTIGKNNGKALMLGVIVGVLFYIMTNIIPGLTIAIPLVPNAIGSNLRWFVVNIVAPIAETIFFLGAFLAYIRHFKPTRKNKIFALILLSFFFSFFHLGAYIFALYDLPTSEGLLALGANVSVFISAFIFMLIDGACVLLTENLLAGWMPHLIINLVNYTKKAIVFALTLRLLT
jgi:membrane protease YdiL (CAAX protease family)